MIRAHQRFLRDGVTFVNLERLPVDVIEGALFKAAFSLGLLVPQTDGGKLRYVWAA